MALAGNRDLSRRDFCLGVAGAAAAIAAPLSLATPHSEPRSTIAIQFGPISLVDEGVEQVLDIFQERARVNTPIPAVFSYSNGTAGRQLQGQPFPGHGKRGRISHFHGGNFATVHPQYYKDTGINPLDTQAPDNRPMDLLEVLLPAANKRGMRVICLVQDEFPTWLPNIDKLQEIDFDGQRADSLCKNNPYVRNFFRGLMEDLTRSYDIAGIMFVCERQGAFSNTIGSRLRGKFRGKPGSRTCFCQYCRQKAKRLGISYTRAVKGFTELAQFVAAGRAGHRPVDGSYVTAWRLMLKYPEMLAWEHLFTESVHELYELMHGAVKDARQTAMFGPHIWHNVTMAPIYRAEQDFADFPKYSDFLKVAIYNNCGGPRIASLIDSISETIYGDVPPAELLQFDYRVLGLAEEPAFGSVREKGLSANYVYRESSRVMHDLAGAPTMFFPGIDIDIPIDGKDLNGTPPAAAARCTRQSVKDAVIQAFRAKVHGIVASRKYSEMQLEHLSGVGDAIEDLGLKV